MFKIFKSLIYYEYDVPLSTISTIMSYICTGLIFVKINNNSLNFIIKDVHIETPRSRSIILMFYTFHLFKQQTCMCGSPPLPPPPKIQISFYMATLLRRCRGPPLAVLNVQWTHSLRKHFLDRHMTCKPPLRIHVTQQNKLSQHAIGLVNQLLE